MMLLRCCQSRIIQVSIRFHICFLWASQYITIPLQWPHIGSRLVSPLASPLASQPFGQSFSHGEQGWNPHHLVSSWPEGCLPPGVQWGCISTCKKIKSCEECEDNVKNVIRIYKNVRMMNIWWMMWGLCEDVTFQYHFNCTIWGKMREQDVFWIVFRPCTPSTSCPWLTYRLRLKLCYLTAPYMIQSWLIVSDHSDYFQITPVSQ